MAFNKVAYRKAYYELHKDQYREYQRKHREKHSSHCRELDRVRLKRLRKTPIGWASLAFYDAKRRAAEKNVPFTITKEDIVSVIPIDLCCPILKNPFQFGNGSSPNNPSLDRITPSKGYVAGNIAIISYRANTIKNDASLSELCSVVDWLKKQV